MKREILKTQLSVENKYLFKRINRLIPVKYEGRDKHGKHQLLCVCNCGNVKVIRLVHLKNGSISSCGCYKRERTAETHKTHGFSYHRAYKRYYNMINRCYDSKDKDFKRYGGRGIKVCDEWLDVRNFMEWANNNGFHPDLEIDRLDNDGNYEPSNCHWTTSAINARNRRSNRWCLLDGEKMCDTDASIKLGLSSAYVESVRSGRVINSPYKDRLVFL